MPISRFVAVSLRPGSSVRSRTLARTGSVLRELTARLTTWRPRARFSCITDSFTVDGLPRAGARLAPSCPRVGPGVSLCSLLSSHSIIITITVWTPGMSTLSRACRGRGRQTLQRGRRHRRPGPAVDDPAGGVDGGEESYTDGPTRPPARHGRPRVPSRPCPHGMGVVPGTGALFPR